MCGFCAVLLFMNIVYMQLMKNKRSIITKEEFEMQKSKLLNDIKYQNLQSIKAPLI